MSATLISHCTACPNQRNNSIMSLGLASDHPNRRAVYSPNQGLGYRLGVVLLLTAILLLISLTAYAQPTGNDYYAPRTGQNDIQLFKNVESYHLGPGRQKTVDGQYASALQEYEFILRYYTNHPQALTGLSELCQKWKSPVCDGVAEGWFQRAIERNPDASLSHVVQALHYHRKNRLDEAVKSYRRAIELAPNSVNAHYNLGLAYADLKQYDLANQHAQKSYSLGANLPGLRARLEKAGKWNPNVTLPQREAKPAVEPLPPALPDKTPE